MSEDLSTTWQNWIIPINSIFFHARIDTIDKTFWSLQGEHLQ